MKLAEKGELLHIPTKETLAVELETSHGALKSSGKLQGMTKTDESQEDSVLNPKLSKHHSHHVTNGIHGQGEIQHNRKSLKLGLMFYPEIFCLFVCGCAIVLEKCQSLL